MPSLLGIIGYGDFVVTATGTGSGASSTIISSFTGTLQPGNTNLIVVSMAASSTATVVDSQGNTYSYTTVEGSGGVATRTGYCINPSVVAGMTITASGTGIAAAVMFVTGKRANPTPALGQQNGAALSGNSLATGNITPSVNQEFLIASSALGTGSTSGGGTPANLTSSGWTSLFVPFVTSSHQGIVAYYQVQKVAAAIGVTFAGSGLKYFGAAITSFSN